MHKSISLGVTIIANSVVWGAIILVCSHALKGTGGYDLIQNYLGAGAGVTTMIIMFGFVSQQKFFTKKAEQDKKEEDS